MSVSKRSNLTETFFRSDPTFETFQHDYVNDPNSLISNSINAMANFAQLMQKDEGILTRGFLPHDEPLPVVLINQASSIALLCHNNAISDDNSTSPVGRNFHWPSSDINAFYHDPSPAAWINSVPVSTDTALHRFWNPDLVRI